MSASLAIPPLPLGTKPLANQVAGHKYGEGKTKLGCLQHEDGTVLKPVQGPPRGQREMDFYTTAFDENCSNKTLFNLRQFIPKFSGIVQCTDNPNVSYLKLENLMHHLSKPSVIDIKMGKRTYDPEAPPEKIALEVAKFPPVLKLGYQLSGMQVFDPELNKTVKYDKYYCKRLFEDTMVTHGLGKFFLIDNGLRKDVIKVVVDKLKELESWFLEQRMYAFYASSILIVYEGDVKHKPDCSTVVNSDQTKKNRENTLRSNSPLMENGDEDTNKSIDSLHIGNGDVDGRISAKLNGACERPLVEIRMIDFTHVFPSQEEDSNYLFGLQNLIKHFQCLLEMPS
ncbi:inositol polyphosphate multikinase-like [Ylistrum balloti]|uniref:inositol polyphosphate multikinase-like n=1 Tax=Ylistrum balloti TaxID=509963 RepID=UPI002905D8D9|nr:inositol polyphosphate multikinase-like [Ylistrum balloti]